MFRFRQFNGGALFNDLNPVVKAFIFSEIFFWSGWNFIIPIVAVFVISEIPGANVQTAASAFTLHIVTRIITELYVSRKIKATTNIRRIWVDCIGIAILSVGYFGIAFLRSQEALFLFYALAGFSFGLSSPAKLALFSSNLEKNSETTSWGTYDSFVLIGMAISTSVGGYVAGTFGFTALFLLASVVNLLGILPYVLFVMAHRRKSPMEPRPHIS